MMARANKKIYSGPTSTRVDPKAQWFSKRNYGLKNK